MGEPTVEQRLRALEGALFHLLSREPLTPRDPEIGGDVIRRCLACHRVGLNVVLHADDCPWQLAREALGGFDEHARS